MTIQDAITLVDRLKPNQYEFTTKVKWLSKLDGMVYKEVISTHEGNTLYVFAGYDNSDPETVLLIPYPYDEDVYNYFLQSQIDKENGENAKFNVTISQYNNSYKLFCDYYNRTHKSLPAKSQFRF